MLVPWTADRGRGAQRTTASNRRSSPGGSAERRLGGDRAPPSPRSRGARMFMSWIRQDGALRHRRGDGSRRHRTRFEDAKAHRIGLAKEKTADREGNVQASGDDHALDRIGGDLGPGAHGGVLVNDDRPCAPHLQVVLAIRTWHPALWATLLGTDPKMRRVPRMPLLPTTMRSALISSARRTITSAGSPTAV